MTGHLVPLLTCDGCQYRQVPATHRDQTLPQYGDDYGYVDGYGDGYGYGDGNGWGYGEGDGDGIGNGDGW